MEGGAHWHPSQHWVAVLVPATSTIRPYKMLPALVALVAAVAAMVESWAREPADKGTVAVPEAWALGRVAVAEGQAPQDRVHRLRQAALAGLVRYRVSQGRASPMLEEGVAEVDRRLPAAQVELEGVARGLPRLPAELEIKAARPRTEQPIREAAVAARVLDEQRTVQRVDRASSSYDTFLEQGDQL